MQDESDFCSTNEIEFARSLSQQITINDDDKLISFDDFCKLVQSVWGQNQNSLEAVQPLEADLIDLSGWGELKPTCFYHFYERNDSYVFQFCLAKLDFLKKFKVSIVGGVKYRMIILQE